MTYSVRPRDVGKFCIKLTFFQIQKRGFFMEEDSAYNINN